MYLKNFKRNTYLNETVEVATQLRSSIFDSAKQAVQKCEVVQSVVFQQRIQALLQY